MTVQPEPWDLRTTWLGGAAWLGALLGLHVQGLPLLGGLLGSVAVATLLAATSPGARGRMVVACLLAGSALAGGSAVRVAANADSPLAAWARERAVVEATLVVRADPVSKEGRFGDYVVVATQLRAATARGRSVRSVVPVLVIGGEDWRPVALGSTVRFVGRLAPSDGGDEAAVLSGNSAPEVLSGPPAPLRVADTVRASVRHAAHHGPADASALVPALVTGDDQALSERVVADFRTAGLTHLTAVSGTNLTLVLAFVLLLARWGGVRGRGLPAVGLLGVVGFLLLARPEPSVLRAAAMGTVALLGLGAGGRAVGTRALGASVLLLLVLDPWLADSPGFALSVLATAGILFVAPPMRDSLATWVPGWLAEAVAVPLAAQIACTPLVAAISGQVSVVAVVANLLAAPAVGPATVLGLVGGLVGLVVPALGSGMGWLAVWCAQAIVLVAHRAAGLPVAAIDWSAAPRALGVLTVLCLLGLSLAPQLLRRRRLSVAAALLMVVLAVRPLPTLGWPPEGWLLVMCDVGQGDALVLATGRRQGVVVDAGPDPGLVDRCLDRLGIRQVPAVVLTHFHADHIDGLPGVLAGRQVGEVEVTSLREPAAGAAQVDRWASAAEVPVRTPSYGETDRVGPVRWQVLAPARILSDSPNDASVVLLVRSGGLRLLLAGDVEPPSQAALMRDDPGQVDVLKVPHHGSRYQDPRLLTGLGARVALVSVGEDNDYGHPDAGTIRLLRGAGALVRRTDHDGDVAVVVRDGRLRVVSRRRRRVPPRSAGSEARRRGGAARRASRWRRPPSARWRAARRPRRAARRRRGSRPRRSRGAC